MSLISTELVGVRVYGLDAIANKLSLLCVQKKTLITIKGYHQFVC